MLLDCAYCLHASTRRFGGSSNFSHVFQHRHGNAFNHGSVSSVAYVGPVLIVVFAAVTPLSLYPFVSQGQVG